MSLGAKIINKTETTISRDSKLWNAVFSMLNALQSVILLFFVTRFCGDDEAGIFSFAFSVAYLMIMIANYGVRNYQATDIENGTEFRGYLIHRIITSLIAVIVVFSYCYKKGYTGLKYDLVILCTILKIIESMEDVFHGEYQRMGRLDVASKLGFIRYISSLLFFVSVFFITDDIVYAFVAMCLSSFLIFVVSNIYICKLFSIKSKKHTEGRVAKLFVVCFPLFITTFFNIYICNAAKYSLERYSSNATQGYYGMLFMPVFVINLLCSFIYRPKLVELAEYWRDRKNDILRRFIIKQMLLILVISIVIIIAGYLIGLKVLSLFYGVDLVQYKTIFVILLLGGGMTATVDFFNNIYTVVRKQNLMMIIYGMVFLVAFFLTDVMVEQFGIKGASFAYTITVMFQALVMAIYMLIFVKKTKILTIKDDGYEENKA